VDATLDRDFQVLVPICGTIFVVCAAEVCDAMKLMGASMLSKLAATAEAELPRGAVAALCAELEAASWSAPSDVHEWYPAAAIDGDVITIPLGYGHCVCLIANYKAGMVVIEYAGNLSTRSEITAGRKPS
jgi:hypothetical protein